MGIGLLLFLLIVLCLGSSAFFSASETAITAASRAKLHQLAKAGNTKAKGVRNLQKNLGTVISTLLMGNTFFNAGAVSLSTAALIRFVGNDGKAYALASFLASALIILYAEVIPKILAVYYPEGFLLRIASPLRVFFFVLRPLTLLINGLAWLHLRVFGIETRSIHAHTTTEELRGIIDLHGGHGQDVPHERAMLKGILDLGSVQVSEIMVHWRFKSRMVTAPSTI